METFHKNFRDPVSEGDHKVEAEDAADIVSFVREQLGFDPDEKQQLVLRGGRRGIVNCTRQWGKSTVTAAKAVHRAHSVAGGLTLVVTPSARQSAEFLRKAEEFVRRLGIKVRGDGDNEISIVFPNGSRIVGLPGNEVTARGYSASLLLIDEAARVDDRLYRAMRPSLAVANGDLWLISTPYGKRGFFWGKSGNTEARSGSELACRPRNARGFRRSCWLRRAPKETKCTGRSTCVSSEKWRGRCFRESRLKPRFRISNR